MHATSLWRGPRLVSSMQITFKQDDDWAVHVGPVEKTWDAHPGDTFPVGDTCNLRALSSPPRYSLYGVCSSLCICLGGSIQCCQHRHLSFPCRPSQLSTCSPSMGGNHVWITSRQGCTTCCRRLLLTYHHSLRKVCCRHSYDQVPSIVHVTDPG
jgi:hypothetical protein